MLREAVTTPAGSKATGEVCCESGVSERGHCHWRKEFSGMQVS